MNKGINRENKDRLFKFIFGNENNRHRINLYSTTLQKFPLPKLVCFYNGLTEMDDKVILHLTDAFDTAMGEPDVEVKVTMLNINYDKNTELLNSCQVLQEYAWFIDRIRINQEEMGELAEAVESAIHQMSDEALIKPFILANKAEVKRMCITEYDEAQTMAMFKEEGRMEGRMELLFDFVQRKIISVEEAAKQANLTVEDFNLKLADYRKS